MSSTRSSTGASSSTSCGRPRGSRGRSRACGWGSRFRQVLFTAKNCQLVVMSLNPRKRSGWKYTSSINSFAWRKERVKLFSMGFTGSSVRASLCLFPLGRIITLSIPVLTSMKLYTLYSPPNHRDGVVHHTRAEAEADNEQFDGKTTE